jgi:hypothetical protein
MLASIMYARPSMFILLRWLTDSRLSLPFSLPFLQVRLQQLATNSALDISMAPYALVYKPLSQQPPGEDDESLDASEKNSSGIHIKLVPSSKLRGPLLYHGAISLLYTLIFILAMFRLHRPLNQPPSLISCRSP